MKNLRILPPLVMVLTLVLLLPSQMGCDLIDKIKGLETFDVDVTVSDYITVDLGENDDTKVFEQVTINPKTHPDLVDYINDISSMELVEAYVTTTQWFNGSQDITFTGTVSLGPVGESYTDIRPADYLGGAIMYLNLDQSDLDDINADLNADKEIVAKVDGFVSAVPVSFELKITVVMVVEVETK